MALQLEIVDASEVVSSLPDPTPLESLPDLAFDVGVFPLGFEERAVACARRLGELGGRIEHVVVPEYSMNKEANETRWPELRAALEALTDGRPDRRRFSPDALDILLGDLVVGNPSPVPRVFVDISGASNSLLLDMIWYLVDVPCDLTLGYAAAKQYLPTREQVLTSTGKLRRRPGARELAQGTGELRIDIHHAGRFSDSGEDLVIMVPGYDRDRSRKVINDVDPSLLSHGSSRVHWILGEPLRPEDAWRRDYQQLLHAQSGCGSSAVTLHGCSTFDYRQIIMLLESIYASVPAAARITLSPMGSKMQAVGAALFCLARREVRVKFALPASYRTSFYSRGASDPVALAFGDSTALAQRVGSVGELRVQSEEGLLFAGKERMWPH